MKISKIIEYILSLPKSVYVSFRLFSLKDAVKVPVLVRYNCSLLSLKGNVIICHRGEAVRKLPINSPVTFS